MNPLECSHKLTVKLKDNGYDIVIGNNMLDVAGDLLKPLWSGNEAVSVVTDENVWRYHGDSLSRSMDRARIDFQPIVLPEGEGNKSMRGLENLYESFARMKLTRSGLVAAFGGGVIGDLCGFTAATWMRGVRFVQIPTTLLAQVDSSVGGKTGINLPQGKNLAGAFYQPKLVVIDPSTLRTLPAREVRCGMAEVVKYGAIRSMSLFNSLSSSSEPDLSEIIHECCSIKSDIVERDELDFGERMILNFGHTLGHAIEKQTGFDAYRHGEAVAFGMALASAIGEVMGATESGVTDELQNTLAHCGLETRYPGDIFGLPPMLASDKKSLGGAVQMVLLRRIGEAFVHQTTIAEIEGLLREVKRKWRI